MCVSCVRPPPLIPLTGAGFRVRHGSAETRARPMADVCVAVHAAQCAVTDLPLGDLRMDEFAVAIDTTRLQNAAVFLFDLNGFVKVLKRESLRMVVSILSLRHVFAEEIVGEMAVDTRCDGMVAGFLPGVELRLHDVAIRAGLGVGAEVGQSFGVLKSETRHARVHSAGEYQDRGCSKWPA